MKGGEVNDEGETNNGINRGSEEEQSGWSRGSGRGGGACRRSKDLCRGLGWWSWELGVGREVTARLARV